MALDNSDLIQVVFGRMKEGVPNGGHRHTYTYDRGIFDVRVGDTVVVPPNWAHPYEQLATVVAFGRGNWYGRCSTIRGIVLRTRETFADTVELQQENVLLWRRINRLEDEAASGKAVEQLQQKVDGLGHKLANVEGRIRNHAHAFGRAW